MLWRTDPVSPDPFAPTPAPTPHGGAAPLWPDTPIAPPAPKRGWRWWTPRVLAGLAALSVLFARLPEALPLAIVFVLPFRVPVTVGDQELGAGCTLMVINGAANRDPRKWDDPDTSASPSVGEMT